MRDSNVIMGNYLLVKGRSQPKMTNKQALREMIIHNEVASWQQKKLCHTRARESDNYSIFLTSEIRAELIGELERWIISLL